MASQRQIATNLLDQDGLKVDGRPPIEVVAEAGARAIISVAKEMQGLGEIRGELEAIRRELVHMRRPVFVIATPGLPPEQVEALREQIGEAMGEGSAAVPDG